MTLLAMWLNKESVAIATDRKMRGCEKPVKKLHRLPSGRVMFGIGFGDGADQWLTCCPCPEHPNDYPAHWLKCSQAKNTEELEQFIRDNLEAGEFPSDCTLALCVAGFNQQGTLEAFCLDETGQRYKELAQGEVWFNLAPADNEQVVKHFRRRKRFHEMRNVRFPGVKALKEVCEELINHANRTEHDSIGLGLEFCFGTLASAKLSYVERSEIAPA